MLKKLEALTNVVLLVVALSVGVLLWTRDTSNGRPNQIYAAGDQLPILQGVRYDAAEKTLIVAVRSGCRYCTESMPFYKGVVQARRDRTRLQVVVATTDDTMQATTYLGAQGVTPDALVSVPMTQSRETLQLVGTPTLFLVDRQGKVVQQWMGKLNPDAEKEVLKAAALL